MMDDIRPPRPPMRPVEPPEGPQLPPPVLQPSATPPRLQPPLMLEPGHKRPPRWLAVVLLGLGAVVLAAFAGAGWYFYSLTPANTGDSSEVRLEVASGSTPRQIAAQLKSHGLIRSKYAFELYTRLSGTRDRLQAGTYALAPSLSVEQIVAELTSGKTDEIRLTFLPGATVADAREVLLKAGYSAAEVDSALKADYDHPVFRTKPASTDLEGYIYGETYAFLATATVEEVLERTFDELQSVVEETNLEEGLAAQGMTLYEGITLASIIQREVSGSEDQRQVSQIFHKRLRENMPLGADATFVYAAKKLGVAPSINIDSPYNTRKYGGLPPGPISAPGLSALLAAANPAEGDYLYFVSGDDGKNYFSRTLEEHERNTAEHCKINCSLF